MENLIKSEVLQQLGLNEKSNWILYDDNARKFFEYLAERVDSSNILSEEEFEIYRNLKESGDYLEGDELTDALKELESEFPGILTVSDGEVRDLEEELKLLEMENGEREDRIWRMEETIKNQRTEIEEQEKRRFEIDFQVNFVTHECLEKAEQLEQLQRSNLKDVNQLNQLYTQPHNPPELIYQMPLDQHYHNCEQILGKIELFMRENFNITKSAEEAFSELEANDEVVELKKRISEVTKKKFEEDLAIAGMKNIVANIDKYRSRDRAGIRAMIDDLEVENENLQAKLDVLEKEAMMLVEQSIDQGMMKIFNEFLEEKNQKSLKRLDTMKSVQDILENVTLLCELLWVAMQLDLERLKNRVDDTAEMASQAQDCAKRIRQMKIIAHRDPTGSFNNFFLKKLQNVLTEFLPLSYEQLPSISACLQEYSRFNEETRAMMSSCIAQENFKNVQDYLREIDSQADLLSELIFTGPTSHPVLYDSKFTMEIYDRQQKKIEFDNIFNSIRADYKKNFVEPLSSDRFFKMEKNLWIYFLTEPKKVLECIKEVQKKASQKGSSSFKALNITVAK